MLDCTSTTKVFHQTAIFHRLNDNPQKHDQSTCFKQASCLPITCFQQESCLPITERVLVKDTVTKEAQNKKGIHYGQNLKILRHRFGPLNQKLFHFDNCITRTPRGQNWFAYCVSYSSDFFHGGILQNSYKLTEML